jgi:hypothetical protein
VTATTITINSVDYASNATVQEADDYLAVDPVRGATWAAIASDDTKGAHLVAATRRISLLSLDSTIDGYDQALEDATILLAGSIAIDAANAGTGTSGSNTKRVKAGSAEVEFFRPTTGVALKDEDAFAILRPYLLSTGSGLFGGKTGCDTASQFTDRDSPELTEAFP